MKRTGGIAVADFWHTLQPREKWILSAGTLLLIVLLTIFLVWLPLQERLQQANQMLAERLTTLEWMQQSTIEIQQLRPQQGIQHNQADHQNRSLLSIVDQTARHQGLGQALQRVEPEGKSQVRLSFDQVAFDGLLRWLALLKQNHTINIHQLTIESAGTTGEVQARLLLGSTESSQ